MKTATFPHDATDIGHGTAEPAGVLPRPSALLALAAASAVAAFVCVGYLALEAESEGPAGGEAPPVEDARAAEPPQPMLYVAP